MWRPPERIKYSPRPGAWPTAQAAAKSHLFSPVRVGPVQLRQRTWVPAMVPWRATEEGFITDELLAWYERFAQGRPGAIVVEATGIRDVPSGPLLRIGHPRFLPGLRELAQTVARASDGNTRLFIQLIDFLRINRRATPEKYFSQHLMITDAHRRGLGLGLGLGDTQMDDAQVRAALAGLSDPTLRTVLTPREYDTYSMGYRERVSDLHLPHIRALPGVLPGLFASAAARAQEAGFDGVELHYAHAYTMASFLSGHNTRDDGYGGDLSGRVRLPLEVYARVREAVGDDYVVGCRYLADDCIDGGMTVEDAAFFGVQFAAAGMDFLSLSRGGKFEDAKQPKVGAAAYPYTGRSGYECMPQYISDATGPFGRNLPATAQIRNAIRSAGHNTPLVAAGGIHGFDEAERVLRDGEADIIGAARQSLSDPDWYLKTRLGHGRDVRVCLYTNYCEALDTRHKQVTCELWDREGLGEPGLMLSSDGKRRLMPPAWQPPHHVSGGGEQSVYEAFINTTRQVAKRPFIYAPAEAAKRYASGAVSYSYEQAEAAVQQLRNAYAGQHLSEGARVAIAYDSRPDVYLHLLALNSLGLSVVPLNMGSTDSELTHVLSHSDAVLVTGATQHISRLGKIVHPISACHLIDAQGLTAAALPSSELLNSRPNMEAALIYTSGTTGKPKGCMLSNEYFLAMGRWYNSLQGACQLDSHDRLLTPLPPNHMNALCTSFMGVLMAGACLVQLDRFHPSTWWQTVRETRATIVHYLGVMPAILLAMPEHEQDNMQGQIKFGFGAGADPAHQQIFEERFGVALIEAWAMSETGAGAVIIADAPPRHLGSRCIGRPHANMALRLVDEQEQDVPPGEPGELLVRHRGDNPRHQFFSGYYKDSEATEWGWRNGWWHTGDVVRQGEDGSLFFVDRRKNVIRRSGENIAAVEVEAVLQRHAAVEQCAVSAVADEMRGEEVFAFIVASPKVAQTAKTAFEILQSALAELSYFKVPGYIAFVDALPLTGSQKIRRGEVKKLSANYLADGLCLDLRAQKRRPRRADAT